MGAIGGLLGTAGGFNGTGIAGPQLAPIGNGTNPQQINNAYTGSLNSLASQQALLQALQGQNGLGNQSQIYGQLQGVANGTGPDPAQAMLNQATGANVSDQAALMAGQRGASANPALMAKLIAEQGAATQQGAAGQGATLQARSITRSARPGRGSREYPSSSADWGNHGECPGSTVRATDSSECVGFTEQCGRCCTKQRKCRKRRFR